ncbi:hypothetical protein AGMMS49593_09310 [Endomicrobiia bacterium]|nr:hypothetical protein AGMMS49593_09310 [Endomicrobiia bacterium]
MLEEVRKKLKEELKKSYPSIWLDNIKEESFKNHVLTLIVPNDIIFKRINDEYKQQLIMLIKEIYNEDIEICLKIIYEDLPDFKPDIEKAETYQEQRRKITTFTNNPNFKNRKEIEKYYKNPEIKLKRDLLKTKIITMPGKYGKEWVACFTTFDSRYFTYPNDSRKTSKVDIKIKIDGGKYVQYELYRGIKAFGTDPIGQLNTTHARILLALVHTWQMKGCTFANSSDYAVAELSIKELAEQLNYFKMSGKLYRWLCSKIEELAYFPNMLSLDGNEAYGFTFLSDIEAWSNKNNYNKTMLRIIFNPFISRQLFERKTHLLNPRCYKIKNPTALKFILGYDKKIVKGNSVILPLKEVVKDLQIDLKETDTMAKNFKRAFKELKGYELNKKYYLKVKLTKNKKDKQYYVNAERCLINKQIVIEKLTQSYLAL